MKMRYTKEAFCQAIGSLYGLAEQVTGSNTAKSILSAPLVFKDEDFSRNFDISKQEMREAMDSSAMRVATLMSSAARAIFTAHDVWDGSWDTMFRNLPDMEKWFEYAFAFIDSLPPVECDGSCRHGHGGGQGEGDDGGQAIPPLDYLAGAGLWLYELPVPIDHGFSLLVPVSEAIKAADSRPVDPDMDPAFDGEPKGKDIAASLAVVMDAIKATDKDLRHEQHVFAVVNGDDLLTVSFGFVVKLDNDGQTFVASPTRLDLVWR